MLIIFGNTLRLLIFSSTVLNTSNSFIRQISTLEIFFFMNFAKCTEDPSVIISISRGLKNFFL